MPTNKYFSNAATNTASEKALLDALTVESIQISGTDFLYMPRKMVNEDQLFGEDPTSEFKKAFEIEMYLETPTDYTGEGEFMSKFGFENRKEITVSVAYTRFFETVGFNRPFEGDWVWHPVTSMLFEISYVEDETILYQLGGQYVFKMTLRVAEYSHEKIDTGYSDVDNVMKEFFNDGTDSNGLKKDREAKNEAIQTEGEAYTDFSETSPFGEA